MTLDWKPHHPAHGAPMPRSVHSLDTGKRTGADLGDLTGDPWTTREEISDRPDDRDVAYARDELRQRIDAMPNPGIVPSDWDEELYGRYQDISNAIPDEYKQIEFDRWEGEITSASRDDYENAKRSVRGDHDLYEGMWSEFQTRFPDLAGNEEAIEAAAMIVARNIRDAGDSAEHVMRTDRSNFLLDVANELRYQRNYEGMTGQITAEREQYYTDRSASVFGAGGAGAGSGSRQSEKPSDMLEDLKRLQRSSGLFALLIGFVSLASLGLF